MKGASFSPEKKLAG